ncbi:hypothetical protein QN362_17330 [Actimicrobium sp. CCC2.4]|uniref:hypothetical protein n=1 Tax=Actimicrobium sp. CCC2.4 TaxID=3048606 RepID=UPI002AC906A7|nr:hypothetical protein [Actimicrobium sp. CCC2.4]MEB0137101.1 hypothetical protein [Actimicrobium sp. CCC2.4]WPX33685.1 hypothetical protein RHM62_07620 [Actimicrobium sp. CCC2.4]
MRTLTGGFGAAVVPGPIDCPLSGSAMPLSCIPSSSSSNGSQSPRPASPTTSAKSDETKARVDALWARLENLSHRQNWAFDDNEVPSNASRVPCGRNNVIKVPAPNGRETAVHANKIGPNTGSPAPYYAAGQSPQQNFSLDNMLVQGIESGLGIYQFVSHRAHTTDCNSSKKTILAMLNERIEHEKNSENSDGTIIAGKYKVLRFDDLQDHYDPYSQYILEVEEINTNPRNIISIPITQAGLEFTGAVLKPAAINMARLALEGHRAILANKSCRANTAQIDPLILSHAGIGRNATLITYDRIYKLIHNPGLNVRIDASNLEEKLFELIKEGRLSRGPRFLHSQQQLAALYAALLDQIAERENKNPDNRKKSVTFRDAHIRHNWHNWHKRFSSTNPLKQFFTSTKNKTAK